MESTSHIYRAEAGGLSRLAGALAIPVPVSLPEWMTKENVEQHGIWDEDIHHAPTRLVCLENTHNGRIYPQRIIEDIAEFCHQRNVSLHLGNPLPVSNRFHVDNRWDTDMACFR